MTSEKFIKLIYNSVNANCGCGNNYILLKIQSE